MEIKQLEYFIVAARMGSISKAAEAMYITQPALSRSIKRLEDDLGFALFDRKNSRIFLTEAGEIFLDSASNAMRYLNEGLAAAQKQAGVAKSEICVASAVQEIPQDLVIGLKKKYPDISICLDFLRSREALAKIDGGSADFAIVPNVDLNTDMTSVLLLAEEMLLYPDENHPLYGRHQVSLQELDGCDVVCNEIGFDWETIHSICSENQIKMNLCFSSNNHYQVGAFKRTLGGVVFVPASALFEAENQSSGAESPADAPPNLVPPARITPNIFKREVYLVYTKNKRLSAADNYLISTLKEYYRGLSRRIDAYIAQNYE